MATNDTGGRHVQAALDRTMAERTVSFRLESTTTSLPSDTKSEPIRGQGVLDFASGRASLGFAPQAAEAAQMAAAGSESPSASDSVFDGSTLYFQSWQHREPVVSPSRWVRLRLTDEAAIPRSDPLMFLDVLRGTHAEPIEIGDEASNDGSLRHYRVEVDPKRAIAAQPDDRRESMRWQFEAAGLDGEPLAIEIWLDDEGRIRRYRYASNITPMLGTGRPERVTGTIITTIDLFDFGAAAGIEPPSPKDVIDVDDLPE